MSFKSKYHSLKAGLKAGHHNRKVNTALFKSKLLEEAVHKHDDWAARYHHQGDRESVKAQNAVDRVGDARREAEYHDSETAHYRRKRLEAMAGHVPEKKGGLLKKRGILKTSARMLDAAARSVRVTKKVGPVRRAAEYAQMAGAQKGGPLKRQAERQIKGKSGFALPAIKELVTRSNRSGGNITPGAKMTPIKTASAMNKTSMYLTFLGECELQKEAKKKSWDDKASSAGLAAGAGAVGVGSVSRALARERGYAARDSLSMLHGIKGSNPGTRIVSLRGRMDSVRDKMLNAHGAKEAGEDIMQGGLAAGGAMLAYKGGKAAYKAMKARKAKKKTEK